jgi:hypothetical protein
MKMKLLLTLILFFSWIADEPAPLTEASVKDKKEQCKTVVDAYYYKYGFLLGTKRRGEQKQATIDSIQREFLVDNQIRVESDDIHLNKRRYDANEYYNDIAEFYGKINGSVKTNIKAISDVYFDNSKNRYFLVANVEKEIVADEEDKLADVDTAKKIVDMYFSFNLADRQPKIFSIQNHKEHALANFSAVKVIAGEAVESSAGNSKTFFVFNIIPGNAEVLVDGVPEVYTNGEKFETTAGNHTVEIRAANYELDSVNATVLNGSSYFVNKSLRLKKGYLNVYPNSPFTADAEIWINGVQIGAVPLKNYVLAVGDYKIKIKKGSTYKTSRVSIAANRNTDLNVALESNDFLRGVVSNNIVYVNPGAVVLPSYYFTPPAFHTYQGQPTHPYYNTAAFFRNNRAFGRYPNKFGPAGGQNGRQNQPFGRQQAIGRSTFQPQRFGHQPAQGQRGGQHPVSPQRGPSSQRQPQGARRLPPSTHRTRH